MTRAIVGWDDLRREPFRVLFPLGSVCGVVGVGHWLLYATGAAAASSPWFHASMQVGAFMLCFIAGFLMTALPRFAAAAPSTTGELLAVLGLLAGQVASLSVGWWAVAHLCFIGLLAGLMRFAWRRFARRESSASPPTEFVWIPIALFHGIAGSALLLLGQLEMLPAWALAVGRPMMQQGLPLGIVLGVGGFMAPRLMGRTTLLVTPSSVSAMHARRVRRRRALTHAAAGVIFLVTCILEGFGRARAAYVLRAAVVTAELWWAARFHRPPAVRDTYVLFVWVALWFVCAGLWGAGLWPGHRIGMLHLTFLGGFSLMVFAVATMVVMSHGGEGPRLQQPLWILYLVGVGIGAAVILRLAADRLPAHYFRLLGGASAWWVAAGLSWLGFVLPRVVRVPPPGAFERAHDEAKRQALASSPAEKVQRQDL